MKVMKIVVTAVLSIFFVVTADCQIVERRLAPIIATSEQGAPIRSYGELYVYDQSPDFQPHNTIQFNNVNPKEKIRPLKSWEIGSNLFGATPPRVPRSAHTDRQFCLPITLIDGDPKTWWVSHGQGEANIEPEWIRLDLAQDQVIDEIVLYPLTEPLSERSAVGLASKDKIMDFLYKNPWPQKLTIKVSLDAWHWDTVYETNNLEAPELGEPMRFSFLERPVKQIWIIGERLGILVDGPSRGFWGHCWAVGEVEALGRGGNWALASRGTGVTTSSVHFGSQGKRQELQEWWSLHYDMGLQWLRVSFWSAVLNWHYVEQEKGVYTIDPVADATITEAVDYGVNVVLGLMYGNWLYTDTPKDNFEGRVEMMPFDPPPSPWKEEHIQGYLNYVRFMVRHFKGRVYAWKLWNEPIDNERYGWCCGEEARRKYAEIVQRVIPIIREEDPGAKILASGQLGDMLGLIASQVDIIDFVRWGGQLRLGSSAYRNQPQQFEEFETWIREQGFKGDLFFSLENRWHGAPYPNPKTHLARTSEIQQAKNLARTMTRHAALGIVSFWNETWNSCQTIGDIGLLRHGFNSGPSHNMTLRPGYYIYRTLCTALAEAEPDPDLEIELDGKGFDEKTVTYPFPRLGLTGESVREVIDAWGFKNEQGQRLVALWLKLAERGHDDCWDDVDRWIRNQFAENQMLRSDWIYRLLEETSVPVKPGDIKVRKPGDGRALRSGLPIKMPVDSPTENGDRVPERHIGTFAGWPSGNDFIYWDPHGPDHAHLGAMHCCAGNANRTIYHIWDHVLRYEEVKPPLPRKGTLRVNLLLNRASKWADVNSYIPYEGRVDIKVKLRCELEVRIPEWVEPEQVHCKVDGNKTPVRFRGRYAMVGGVERGAVVALTFPISERTVRTMIGGLPYTLIIKGNDVVCIDPPGKHYPLYQRDHYRGNKTRWVKRERFVADQVIQW